MGDRTDIPTAQLELRWATRHGLGWGSSVHVRRYLDFVVDGRSLLAALGGGDFVTPFGWLRPWVEEEAARQLLLVDPSPLEGGRRELYVCPECADLGCGALTAVIERAGDRVFWRDFGYQREPGEAAIERDGCEGVGPLAFARDAYEDAIHSAPRRARDERA